METANKILIVVMRVLVGVLVLLMLVAVGLGTVELAMLLASQLGNAPGWLLRVDEFQEFFGFFIMVLIGIGLLEAARGYLRDNALHGDMIMLVGVIALVRGIVVTDYSAKPLFLLATAAALLALTAGIYLMRRGSGQASPPAQGKKRRWEGEE